MNKNHRFETRQIHVGQENPDPATDARAVPIYATTSYVFKDSDQAAARFALAEPGNIYNRLMNPTADVFEKRIAALEGGAGALAVATGAAAIAYAVQNIARAGDHIVSAANVYGGTYNLFAHTFAESGIETTFVDGSNPDNFAKAIRENTKALYVESLDNPNCNVADIDALAEVAHAHGIPLIVDGGKFDWTQNDKFPGISQPNPNCHGAVLAEICGPLAYIMKIRTTLLRDTGATISPFNSFLLLQGLETLSLRVERHVQNALRVVDYLAAHPQVRKVNHPSLPDHPDHELYRKYYPNGGGSIFTFEIKGGAEKARKFCESLELFSLLANVADVKSLVIHPASTTHSQMTEEELKAAGISPSTVRLSIGTEHIDDILEDLEQGFRAIL